MLMALAFVSIAAFAQDDKYVYAEIVGAWGPNHLRQKIYINFGDLTRFSYTDTYSDSKTREVFKTMVDAINWMSSKGWEFVQMYNDYTYYEVFDYNVLNERCIVRKNIKNLSPEEQEAVKGLFPAESDIVQSE